MTHPDRKVNPECVRAAANMAIPGKRWKVLTFMGLDDWITVVGAKDDSRFNPLDDDSDAMKLERALKEPIAGYYIGWYFCKKQNGLYAAYPPGGRCIEDKSDTLLLLKCVSAQTGIALWVEGEDSATITK
jgi:hypothetical protein